MQCKLKHTLSKIIIYWIFFLLLHIYMSHENPIDTEQIDLIAKHTSELVIMIIKKRSII